MLIEIDTIILDKYEISPNQYIFLYLLDNNKSDSSQAMHVSHINKDDIIDLVNKRIVQCENTINGEPDISNISIRPIFSVALDTSKCFDELLALYPVSVIRSDGTKDYLKTDTNRCRKSYNKIIGKNITKHQEIMDCLRFELDLRYNQGSLSYMKRLPKWIASEEWDVYKEAMKEEQIKTVSYGQQLL